MHRNTIKAREMKPTDPRKPMPNAFEFKKKPITGRNALVVTGKKVKS